MQTHKHTHIRTTKKTFPLFSNAFRFCQLSSFFPVNDSIVFFVRSLPLSPRLYNHRDTFFFHRVLNWSMALLIWNWLKKDFIHRIETRIFLLLSIIKRHWRKITFFNRTFCVFANAQRNNNKQHTFLFVCIYSSEDQWKIVSRIYIRMCKSSSYFLCSSLFLILICSDERIATQ